MVTDLGIEFFEYKRDAMINVNVTIAAEYAVTLVDIGVVPTSWVIQPEEPNGLVDTNIHMEALAKITIAIRITQGVSVTDAVYWFSFPKKMKRTILKM